MPTDEDSPASQSEQDPVVIKLKPYLGQKQSKLETIS